MSRAIEFRAWNGQEMLHCPLNSNFAIGRFFAFIPENAELMQFTGLTDCFGNKVFEGDIFNRKTDKRHPQGGYIAGTSALHPENSAVVEWGNGGFFIDGKPLHEFLWFHSLDGHKIGVVGNIYENPELLEQKP